MAYISQVRKVQTNKHIVQNSNVESNMKTSFEKYMVLKHSEKLINIHKIMCDKNKQN